jgi:ABC-type methionine transport system ATPase subunit
MRPRALLFDEPTSALDPESSREVLTVMRELAEQDVTMVVVTHEMRFAENVSDRVLFMESGRVIESGPAEKVFNDPTSPRARSFFAEGVARVNRPQAGVEYTDTAGFIDLVRLIGTLHPHRNPFSSDEIVTEIESGLLEPVIARGPVFRVVDRHPPRSGRARPRPCPGRRA